MKWVIRGTWFLLGLILLVLAGTFLFKDKLLAYGLKKVQVKVYQDYHAQLSFKKVDFTGIKTIEIDQITLQPENNDTLLTVGHVTGSVSLRNLFAGRFSFSSLSAENITLRLIKQDSSDNFSFLWRSRKKEPNDSTAQSINLGKLFNAQIRNLFHRTPSDLQFINIRIEWWDKYQPLLLEVPKISLKDGDLDAELTNTSNRQTWVFAGHINRSEGQLDIKWCGRSGPVSIPYIDKRWEAKVNFDTAFFSLNENSYSDKILHLKGNTHIRKLLVSQPKLSPREVVIESAGADYQLSIDDHSITLDSTSLAYLNAIEIHPFVQYIRRPIKKLSIAAKMPVLEADAFFNSLPAAIFDKLEGIKTYGSLSYSMNFDLDFNRPDSLHFNSELKKHNFKILKFGSEFLPKINNTFSYTAYEKGVPVKTFDVGPENPDFTPLWNIPGFLQGAVLCSEDGGFYYHRGFNEEAFRNSIVDNIRKGRFARGGSTISMQLVKNIFLNRNKNIGRKLQEALIVWLIEQNGLCSKDRMFEVYLNIIEWGPGIYGVKEAAEFYFRKKPMELNLAECIFLASIIPSPKSFKYSFEPTGVLKSKLYGYFKLVSAHMLRKEFISEDEYNNLLPYIELKGRAKQFIVPSDSLPTDIFIQ